VMEKMLNAFGENECLICCCMRRADDGNSMVQNFGLNRSDKRCQNVESPSVNEQKWCTSLDIHMFLKSKRIFHRVYKSKIYVKKIKKRVTD
jgi:hypothetical protein